MVVALDFGRAAATNASATASTSASAAAGPRPPTVGSALLRLLRRGAAVIWRHPILVYLVVCALMYRRIRDTMQGNVSRVVESHKRLLSVKLTRDEDSLMSCVVDPTDIADTLDSVGGLAEVKRTVSESVVKPYAAPELYPPGSLLSPPKGVLLYGPPGTGKTLLARALAKEVQGCFIEVRADSILSKWVGETEKKVAAIFSLARKLTPAVLFIDEMEALLGRRGMRSESQTFDLAKMIFLTQWDGLLTNEAQHRVLVVGATNRPGDIDEAVLRRMPVKLRVAYPSQEAREQILRIILERDDGLDAAAVAALPIPAIAKAAAGYSGSDLKELCKKAALTAVQDQGPQKGKLVLKAEHLLQAMRVVGSNQSFVQREQAGLYGPSRAELD